MAEPELCSNCGASLAGKFCHECGQKVIEGKERTLWHFLYQFFGAAFFLENNFIKNLWYLLTRPGFLPDEYLQGRRKRYMSPISLFLLINLVYFITVHLTDFNLTLNDQIRQPHHAWIARVLVDNRLAERNMKLEEYAEVYNGESTALSKTLIILNVPVFTFFLTLIYWRKKMYFTDHMIFTFYLMSFVLAFSILNYGLLEILVMLSILSSQGDVNLFLKLSMYLMIIVVFLYFFFALKRFYKQNLGWTLFMFMLVFICFIATHFIYRSMLFFIIFLIT